MQTADTQQSSHTSKYQVPEVRRQTTERKKIEDRPSSYLTRQSKRCVSPFLCYMAVTDLCSMNVSGGEELPNDKSVGFAGKLYEILEAESSPTRGIEWSADGDTICIFPQRFNEYESKQHFQGTLYGSFTRRLYRYGFDRLVISPSSKADYPNGAHVYRNDLFRRDRPDLVKIMKVDNKRLYRKAVRQKKAESKQESENEKAPLQVTVTTSEKKVAPQNHEEAQGRAVSVADLLHQELVVRMQQQLNASLRNVDNGLNLSPFLVAALSHARNYQNASHADVSNVPQNTATPSSRGTISIQNPAAGPMPVNLNSAPINPSFLVDSQIMELLRLQYRR